MLERLRAWLRKPPPRRRGRYSIGINKLDRILKLPGQGSYLIAVLSLMVVYKRSGGRPASIGEIQSQCPGYSELQLARQLKRLAEDGLVKRRRLRQHQTSAFRYRPLI